MGALESFRQQYPGYGDMSDQALADALYGKFYSDMPRESFNAKLGLAPQAQPAPAAPSWMDLLTGSQKAQEFSAGMDPRVAAEAQRQGTTPQELGQRHEGYAGEFLKGVPVAGAAMPQTEAMTRVEREYPWSTLGARAAGGTLAMAPAMAAAPAWMGVTGGLGMRALASGGSGAGISLADQAARQGAEAAGGAPAPNPSATFEALGLPNTGYRPVDAAIMAGAIGPAATVAGAGVGAALGPALSKSAAFLRDAGVKLTPGMQIGGLANEAGNLATAVPLSGMAGLRRDVLPSYNRAAENMALRPLDVPEFAGTGVQASVPGGGASGAAGDVAAGFEGRQFVHQQASKAYDVALRGAPGEQPPEVWFTPSLVRGAEANARATFPEGMRPETLTQFETAVDNLFTNRLAPVYPGHNAIVKVEGDGLANALQEIDKTAARALKRGGDGYDLSEALKAFKAEILGTVQAQEPKAAARLAAANEAWAHYAELRAAGQRTAAGGVEGLVTPEVLAQGSKAADISFAKTASSEGTTKYGDFARAGIDVGVGVPVKATPGQQIEAAIALAAGAHVSPALGAIYPLLRTYATPPAQWTANAYLHALAPTVRAGFNQGLPRAAAVASMPSQNDMMRRALLGD